MIILGNVLMIGLEILDEEEEAIGTNMKNYPINFTKDFTNAISFSGITSMDPQDQNMVESLHHPHLPEEIKVVVGIGAETEVETDCHLMKNIYVQ